MNTPPARLCHERARRPPRGGGSVGVLTIGYFQQTAAHTPSSHCCVLCGLSRELTYDVGNVSQGVGGAVRDVLEVLRQFLHGLARRFQVLRIRFRLLCDIVRTEQGDRRDGKTGTYHAYQRRIRVYHMGLRTEEGGKPRAEPSPP